VGGDSNQYGDTDGNNSCEGNLSYNVIRQNLLYNHGPSGGIVVFHTGGIKIQANTIIGSSSSKWGIRLDESAYCPKITLQSNIIYGHSDAELILDDYNSLTVDNNNLLYNSNSNIYKTQVGKTYWYFLSVAKYKTATGKGQGSLSANPKFVNASGKDFHLAADSPAIDSGVNVGLKLDFDGYSRPEGQGYDMGVYEYSSAVRVLPTASPTSLTLSSPILISPANNGTPLTHKACLSMGRHKRSRQLHHTNLSLQQHEKSFREYQCNDLQLCTHKRSEQKQGLLLAGKSQW
jgi:hypothetical protein